MESHPTASTPSSSSSSSSSSKSLDQLNTKHSSSQSFQLSPLLLVSTLDGQLHALDRQTGTWNWTLNDPNHHAHNLFDHTGLIHSPCLSSDQSLSDQDHELYTIEPHNDGDLYVFIKSSTGPSRLEKLPLSVSQLVNLSPFTFPGDSSKMFIGKKESHLIAIDLTTGIVLNSLNSNPEQVSFKGKEKSTSQDQSDPRHLFSSSATSSSDTHRTCPIKPENSNPTFQHHHTNHESIDQRPRDILYIGRTGKSSVLFDITTCVTNSTDHS
jgi:serine/threonine-protein kinase/endoribonuclease IRE1